MQIKTILFPTDFSYGAHAAMDFAVSLAKNYNSQLILLHVIQNIVIADWDASSSFQVADMMKDIHKSAMREMDRWCAEVSSKINDMKKMIVAGVPFVEIIKAARNQNADMIVIGTHGRMGVSHVLLGSTAEKVARKASCPVLTVRIPSVDLNLKPA